MAAAAPPEGVGITDSINTIHLYAGNVHCAFRKSNLYFCTGSGVRNAPTLQWYAIYFPYVVDSNSKKDKKAAVLPPTQPLFSYDGKEIYLMTYAIEIDFDTETEACIMRWTRSGENHLPSGGTGDLRVGRVTLQKCHPSVTRFDGKTPRFPVE